MELTSQVNAESTPHSLCNTINKHLNMKTWIF